MSANNMIIIDKKTFVVKDVDSETGHGFLVGKAKNLEEAIDIAEKQIETEGVEYGIRFVSGEQKARM